eukprot:872799-Prorocentrum_minimum.AAC.1
MSLLFTGPPVPITATQHPRLIGGINISGVTWRAEPGHLLQLPALFAHHHVDGKLLLRLDKDLLKKELDVVALGHREHILEQLKAHLPRQEEEAAVKKRPVSAPRARAGLEGEEE